MNAAEKRLFDEVARALPEAHDLRRSIHRSPFLGGEEHATTKLITERLPQDVPITRVADAGAVILAGSPGPPVGIRAELDALPITEATPVEWASTNHGVMHACGHDVHLAALWTVLTAALRVGDCPPLLGLLQPREESYPSGAHDVIRSGVLHELECRSMIGVHVQPELRRDVVACVPGGVNASSDEFTIDVEGTSGHAAYPHRTKDPIVALANIVVALQSVPSRSVDPMDAVVVSVSTVNGGDAANTVPGHARARGTVRCLSPGARDLVLRRIHEVSSSVALAHGCTASVDVARGEPVLVNDPELTERIGRRLTADSVETTTTFRSVGSDDFSYFGEEMASCMLFVGTEARGTLHSPTFVPTDDDLEAVAYLMLRTYLAASQSRP